MTLDNKKITEYTRVIRQLKKKLLLKFKKDLCNIWNCSCRMDNDLIDRVKGTKNIPLGGKAYMKGLALSWMWRLW